MHGKRNRFPAFLPNPDLWLIFLLEDGIIFQFPKLNLFNTLLCFFKNRNISGELQPVFNCNHSVPLFFFSFAVGFNGENIQKLSLVRWLFFLWNVSVPFSIHCSQWWPQSLSIPGKPIFALQIAPVLPETFLTWVTNLILLVP